jgi:glycosyltransferase involved in cell wall biosynthesis
MRFAMLTTFYPPFSYGGDATYVRALARSLVARGHEVDVIASTDAYLIHSPWPATVPPDKDDGVCVHRLRHRLGLAAALLSQQTGRSGVYTRAINRILAKPYDVLHFHNISLIGGPGLLSMGTARARLYSLHEHWLVCPTHILWKNQSKSCDKPTCFSCSVRSGLPPQLWRYTRLRDRQLENVDRLLSPSEFTAERHLRGGVSRPITVLPLFSSLDPPAKSPLASSRPVILFVGRVTASKGVEQLIRVAAALPEIDCIIIGEGDLRASLSKRYASHPHIRFTGPMPQSQLIEYYQRASALILPSMAPETFGLTIVEAAACGTPAIVAARSGGAAEIVKATGGGLIYEGDEPLSAAILQLASDDMLRTRLGAMARRGYEEHYTRERHVDAYLAEVDAIMDRKS